MLEFSLLFLNGLAIINRERVLNKVYYPKTFLKNETNLHMVQYLISRQGNFHSDNDNSVVLRLVNLILAIQTVLRCKRFDHLKNKPMPINYCIYISVPLIFLNTITIFFKLVFG